MYEKFDVLGFNDLCFQSHLGVTEYVFQTNPLTFHPRDGENNEFRLDYSPLRYSPAEVPSILM